MTWSFRPHRGIIFFNVQKVSFIMKKTTTGFRPHRGIIFFNSFVDTNTITDVSSGKFPSPSGDYFF